MRRPLIALAAALVFPAGAAVFPAGAAAHVLISPPFVERGAPTDIALTVPNERPPHATVAIRVEMPADISIVSTAAPTGWTVALDGSTVTWSGGRIEGRSEIVFSLRIQATVPAGTYTVDARQVYDDDATVRWKSDLSVLPATDATTSGKRPWTAITASVIGIVVITSSLAVLYLLRRRTLQVR